MTTFSTTLGMFVPPGEPVIKTGSPSLNAISGAVFPSARLFGAASFMPGLPGLGKAPGFAAGEAVLKKVLSASVRAKPDPGTRIPGAKASATGVGELTAVPPAARTEERAHAA